MQQVLANEDTMKVLCTIQEGQIKEYIDLLRKIQKLQFCLDEMFKSKSKVKINIVDEDIQQICGFSTIL